MTPEGGPALAARELGELLGDVAARTAAPGGGTVAALAVAMAASLAAMAARFSDAAMPGADAVASRCDALAARAIELADADGETYAEVLEARRGVANEPGRARDACVGTALLLASEGPIEIAEIAAEVAELGSRLASAGNPNLVGDALTALALGEAAAAAAARLVEINLASLGPSVAPQRARAAAAAGRAGAARRAQHW